MLYLLTAAKTIFPLLTLPYLARVLSVDCYGTVSYVKAVVGYAQIIVDFGFILSAVKEIVEVQNNKDEISKVVGSTVISRLMLALVAFVVILAVSNGIVILRNNWLYVCIALLTPVMSSFLLDFLFRGIEKMHIVTIIFVIMKTISVGLTFIFVKNDSHILLIPIFDVISSLIAVLLNWMYAKKFGYRVIFTSLKCCFEKIKNSFGYFANSIASTAFGALNTVILGVFMTDMEQIAYWSVCMQIVGAVQNMYTPIANGIYPYMIKSKDLKLIKNILVIFTPIIMAGTAICYAISPIVLTIVAGEKYVGATPILRMLLPIIIMSFPVAILGWPALGAINTVKQTTISTILGAATQGLGLLVLLLFNNFTIINIAILRNISEFVMLFTRSGFLYKHRRLFTKERESMEDV
jgi:PST family polysaccharide transporter